MVEYEDPIRTVVDIFERLYPSNEVTINFVQGMYEEVQAYGETFFPDNGSSPVISIDVSMPLIGVVDVISHELSHVVMGKGKAHCKEWEEIFNRINNEFNGK
jgi:hypothetical protein